VGRGQVVPAEPEAPPEGSAPDTSGQPDWAGFNDDPAVWTDEQRDVFHTWFDALPTSVEPIPLRHAGVIAAFRDATSAHFAVLEVSEREPLVDLEAFGPIVGETVFFRSAQSDLSGTAKSGQEVPAMITQVHSAKTVDLTVFRPNGMTPIGVVNVQNHPAGKDSPFHTSWRRPTQDDLPRS
jgi:hypothetical protein